MGLTVNYIQEANISKTDFSKYRLLFVGDERFKNPSAIPIWKFPTVIDSFYHGPEWGITDSDGVSQLGRNTPMSVKMAGTDDIIEVYTQGTYDFTTLAIPYYYLSFNNKVPTMQQVAGTYSGDSYNLGDVISYGNAGIHLDNGRITQANICFFGIVTSKYWTDDAKIMFENCVRFVGSRCSEDSDCGEDIIGDKYCGSEKGIFQNTTEFMCNNPGSVLSKCVNTTTAKLFDECLDDELCFDNDKCKKIECFNNSQ